jgi:bacillithiol synthase
MPVASAAIAAPPLVPARRVPFGQLGGFPLLFQRYAAGDPAAFHFFAHDWRDPAALAVAARTAAEHPRDRAVVADVLVEQNQAWGNVDGLVRSNLEALARPESAAVVTGQQLGLFGGPLYTVYKAITAIQLARSASATSGRPVVPVFWLADEDHDWDEVRTAVVRRGDDPVRIALPGGDDRTPVGRRTFGPEIADALAMVETVLPRTLHTAEVLDALRDAYRPEATVREAFARWMAHLFAGTGLVLVSGDDARLKRLVATIFRREIEEPVATMEALFEAGRGLKAAGFHQQVTPLAGNLFVMEPEGRFTLDPQDGGFVLRGLGREITRAELLDRLDAEPEAFSPNVILRPIIEDALLPTAAYVAGPGEASYYAQLGGVYRHFGVPMPVVYPRASVTLVEAPARRVLQRYGLELPDLAGPGANPEERLDALHARLSLAHRGPDLDAAFTDAASQLETAADLLRPAVGDTDPTLEASAEVFRVRLQQALDRLRKKTVRAEKRKHAEIRTHLERALALLAPFGRPQERVLSPVAVLNAHGADLVARLVDGLPLETDEHLVVEV